MLKRLQPSEELAAVVGHEPSVPGSGRRRILGVYPRERFAGREESAKDQAVIFSRVFYGGREQGDRLELTRGVNRPLFACAEAKQNRRNQRTASIGGYLRMQRSPNCNRGPLRTVSLLVNEKNE